jgi:hypothetical protein
MNIRINAIAPGPIDTEANGTTTPQEMVAEIAKGIPVSRMGTPDDLVGMCLFLLSDQALDHRPDLQCRRRTDHPIMSEHVKLGYIGLGNIGAPMAQRMVDWRGGVTVFDVQTEAMTPLAEAGATLADSVADVAAADIISVTVLNDEQVREVVGELARKARRGTVIAIHSTITDTTAVELAGQLQPQGFTSSMPRSVAVRRQPRRASWQPWSGLPTRRSPLSTTRSRGGHRWRSTWANRGQALG